MEPTIPPRPDREPRLCWLTLAASLLALAGAAMALPYAVQTWSFEGIRPTAERCLHRQVGREETDHAVGHLRSELCARLTEEFAGDGARRKDCLR